MNALSEKLDLTVFRDQKEYFISFKNGKTASPINFIKKTKKSGTKITFLPSKDVFSSIKFNASTLHKKMRELAFLNKGLQINLIDETHTKTKVYESKYSEI